MLYLTELKPNIKNHHVGSTGNFPFISDVEKYVKENGIEEYEVQKPGPAGYVSVGTFKNTNGSIERLY